MTFRSKEKLFQNQSLAGYKISKQWKTIETNKMSLLNQATKDMKLTTSSPFKTNSYVKSNEMSKGIYEARFLNILLLFNNECRVLSSGARRTEESLGGYKWEYIYFLRHTWNHISRKQKLSERWWFLNTIGFHHI